VDLAWVMVLAQAPKNTHKLQRHIPRMEHHRDKIPQDQIWDCNTLRLSPNTAQYRLQQALPLSQT